MALSRKTDAQWLLDLGAAKIVSPDDVVPEKDKPLAKQTFAAVIDTVGGPLLAAVLPQIAYGAVPSYAAMLVESKSKRLSYHLFCVGFA